MKESTKKPKHLFMAYRLRELISWEAQRKGLATYNVNQVAKDLGKHSTVIYNMVGALNGPGYLGFHDMANAGGRPRPLNKPSGIFLIEAAEKLDWNPLFILGIVGREHAYLSDMLGKLEVSADDIRKMKKQLQIYLKE